MIDSLAEYFRVWQTDDPVAIRRHVERSLTEDVEWCDPNYDLRGHDAVVAMVVEFHDQWPDAKLELVSEVDGHHDRYRYEWLVTTGGRKLVRGMDAIRIADDGRISRIDGFFGKLGPA